MRLHLDHVGNSEEGDKTTSLSTFKLTPLPPESHVPRYPLWEVKIHVSTGLKIHENPQVSNKDTPMDIEPEESYMEHPHNENGPVPTPVILSEVQGELA